jgi:exosortase A-associated hydrolase 2
VYVHPWAEEMNKTRRMAALASRALAADGWAVLQIDLLGCGDSSGDFGDASWDDWVDDVVRAADWLNGRYAGAPLWLWGLRAGALVATDAAGRMSQPVHFLFWQPALLGKAVLQQFLRLKAAARLADGNAKAALGAARADLDGGRLVEVAGYTMHPALARGLQAATLAPPTVAPVEGSAPRRVVWLELASDPGAGSGPATRAAQTTWNAARWRVESGLQVGPSFWQTTEIEEAPALVDATREARAA